MRLILINWLFDSLNASPKEPLELYLRISTQYPATQIPLEPSKSAANKGQYLPFEANIPRLRGL